MRIEVQRRLCEGHGLCVQTAPDVYELDDEGYAQLRVDPVPTQLEAAAMTGARVCPVAALRVLS